MKLRKDKDYTTFSFKELKIDRKAFKSIIFIGLPAGIQSALFSISNMLIQSSIVKVNNAVSPGTEYQPIVNGNAAAGNLDGFIYTAMNAVYQGAITFTSQNIGAKKPYRVKRILYSCLLIVTMIGLVTSCVILTASEPLLSLYGIRHGEEGSLQMMAMSAAKTRMRYVGIPYFLCGMMEVCTGVLRGLGKSMTSMIISLIGGCMLRMVWIWTVFSVYPTLETVFLSYPVTWIITTTCAFCIIHVLLKKIIKRHEREEAQP